MHKPICIFLLVLSASVSFANNPNIQQQSPVDFSGFIETSNEVFAYRENRLVDLDTFHKLAKDDNTIILDTRSAADYKRKHLKNAVHLNFSEFSVKKLAKIIPDKNTKILIYCNNNFSDDSENFVSKRIKMALNIPTFINLYDYGYKNIYELADLVSVKDSRVKFVGTSQTNKL